ncbi:MAG: hypothetical protein U9Q76_07650, partial [candidate division WOR-3 bacterium]|nr:hypothetical protein [candidate division WOR-3 bacterium]
MVDVPQRIKKGNEKCKLLRGKDLVARYSRDRQGDPAVGAFKEHAVVVRGRIDVLFIIEVHAQAGDGRVEGINRNEFDAKVEGVGSH